MTVVKLHLFGRICQLSIALIQQMLFSQQQDHQPPPYTYDYSNDLIRYITPCGPFIDQ